MMNNFDLSTRCAKAVWMNAWWNPLGTFSSITKLLLD